MTRTPLAARRLAPVAALVLASLSAPVLAGPSGRAANAAPPQTVAQVDVRRYAGRWYEIARYPNSFQRDCQGVTAEYTLRPDGRVGVLNTCRTGTRNGRPRAVSGRASVIEGSNGAKLAVNFAPFPLPAGQGNYWVLHLEPDYRIALVGDPSGKYLWMLSRTPRISPADRAILNAAAQRQGYRLDMLVDVQQP